ncbi:hypothetical protein IFM12275_69130 (plasmid) [Nocardia sputorum]|uniref:hypothetical protein n=1 Tax=Nocardia sputorum TaxID=2984338 RepID=UPI002492806A|nr:hypothetical protein [Nocardia sputorum]BDT96937.1 hypothetical protein IFM12275_69130 [Nocardia sputorum]
MPPRLSRPTDVPENHWPLIDMLWRFYIAAGDPPMRKIARAIEELDDDQRKGTANHETIRRTLGAIALPQWETVEVIFLALCQIANVDPDDIEPDDGNSSFGGWEPTRSHRDELHWCYRMARYGSVTALPRTRDQKAQQEAAEAARSRQLASMSGSDDEPPF